MNLIKPPFSPPDQLFAPVWTVLYILMAAALVLYIRKPAQNKNSGYVYFALQLILNLAWSPVFFMMKQIAAAFAVIVLIDISAFAAAKKFYEVSKPAGLILIPYLLWLLFASYLNLGYLILNGF